MLRVSLAVAAALMAGPTLIHAQIPSRVEPRARVRVWATSLVLNGEQATVGNVHGDTLRLEFSDRMKEVPLDAVSRLDVRTRRKGGHKLKGFVAGMLLGGIIGYTSFRPSAGICDFRCDMRPLNAAFAGLLGGLGGLVLGSFLPPARWERVH